MKPTNIAYVDHFAALMAKAGHDLGQAEPEHPHRLALSAWWDGQMGARVSVEFLSPEPIAIVTAAILHVHMVRAWEAMGSTAAWDAAHTTKLADAVEACHRQALADLESGSLGVSR